MTHFVDVHVGRQIRKYRIRAEMTQHQLAVTVGVKFQQIQKYECGANRVSASRLHDIALALDAPVSEFFDGVDQPTDAPALTSVGSDASPAVADVGPPIGQFTDKEALEFVRLYYELSAEPRRRLLDLTKSLAKAA